MNCDEFEQLSALHALGLLDAETVERLRSRTRQDPAAAAELARFLAVTAALAASPEPVAPPASARDHVLDRIRRTPQAKTASPASPAPPAGPPPLPPGFRIVTHDAPWLPGPLPLIRFKVLSVDPAQSHAMLLIELGPGAVYPEHDHEGGEDLFVLTGDLQTENRSLGPGDLIHGEPGSHHHELRSINGCTALLVVPRESLAGQIAL